MRLADQKKYTIGCIGVRLASFEPIIGALHGAKVRYLIAGGPAVGAHGYLRSTRDVDLIVRLVAENVERLFAAPQGLGYRAMASLTPRPPGGLSISAAAVRKSTFGRAYTCFDGYGLLGLWDRLDNADEHPFAVSLGRKDNAPTGFHSPRATDGRLRTQFGTMRMRTRSRTQS